MDKIAELQSVIDAWDAGKEIDTIDLSGFGGGYEMACQHIAIEIVRECIKQSVVEKFGTTDTNGEEAIQKEREEFFHKAASDADDRLHLGGITGAMFYASANLAVNAIWAGWKGMLKHARTHGCEAKRFIKMAKAPIKEMSPEEAFESGKSAAQKIVN